MSLIWLRSCNAATRFCDGGMICAFRTKEKNNSKTIKALEERENSLYDHELGGHVPGRTQREQTPKGGTGPQIKSASFPRTTRGPTGMPQSADWLPLLAQEQTGRQGRGETGWDAGTPHPRPGAEAPTPSEVGALGGGTALVR